MSAEWSSMTFDGKTTFVNGSAQCGGGLLVYHSEMRVNGSLQFNNNSVVRHGGGACVVYSSVNIGWKSTFTGNRALLNGGCVYIQGSNVSFSGNSTLRSSVALGKGAAIILFGSSLNFSGISSFADNLATLGSVIHMANSTAHFGGNTIFSKNIATLAGSGIFSLDSFIKFGGTSSFDENWVRDRSGLFHMSNSTLCFTGNSRFTHNIASNGAVLYAMTRSKIQFHGHSTFEHNFARRDGGALYLVGNSRCYFWPQASVYLLYNTAGRYGGAIHIIDSNPSIDCEFYEAEISDSDYDYDCFFQIPSTNFSHSATKRRLAFQYNSAGEAGSALFGGAVEKCKLSGFDQGVAFEQLTTLTKQEGDTTSIVASHPFRVCVCIENHWSICIQHGICTDYVHIRKHPGETFFVPAVAMGQRCGTVPTYVRSYFEVGRNGRFVDFQNIQPVGKTCTNLTYTIFSSNTTETVKLYADGQCSTSGHPLTIHLVLLPCPHGFMLSKSGACVYVNRGFKNTQTVAT